MNKKRFGLYVALATGLAALLLSVPTALLISWLLFHGPNRWAAIIPWLPILGAGFLMKAFLDKGRWVLACLVWLFPIALSIKAFYDFLQSPL
ncbi:hypothetical protein [Azospirillum soli]|uniref:hypothetical protein n=1 Tax=Azospirillum soli TaxID=1304799 RepID=UPI001AE15A8E|nr:hypothetical protein [Azospirillum soli]MBP2312208.1 hypothetical protein [Azospirillum soli]